MKHVSILLAFIACAVAAGDETYSRPLPYSYNYEVKDDQQNNYGQSEVVDSKGVVSGSYHVLLPDGRHQYVTYKDEGFGLVSQVTYKGESIYPEFKVAAKPSLPEKKTGLPVANKETKEEASKKSPTIQQAKSAPVVSYKTPVAVIPQTTATKKPSAPIAAPKKQETTTAKSSVNVPLLQPIYNRQPTTTEANYKVSLVAPKKAYTTPAYKAPIATTPAYKTPSATYSPTTFKTLIYATPPAAYKEQVKKVIPSAVGSSVPYNKATPYVGQPIVYHKMPVYKGPTYRTLVNNPTASYQKPGQIYQAPTYKLAPSYSVPTYKQFAKY